jgi:hypothetical protein
LKTTDGGATWVNKDPGLTSYHDGVHFPVDAQTGYVVGVDSSGGTILKTTDGGTNWQRQNCGTQEGLYTVHFPMNDITGYVAGWYGTILKTTNGGSTWLMQPSGTNNSLNTIYFPSNDLTGYAVGGGGTILKTTNGGVWVEEARNAKFGMRNAELRITPNPFTSFAAVPGHSSESFALYDISGRWMGVYKGDRIGRDVSPGVYFLRAEKGDRRCVRIVKLR